jgi:hypothetical protein
LDKDLAPFRLNSHFTSSSNVRRPTVQQFTSNFVPTMRFFAFSNVNSREVGSNAIGLNEVPLKFIKKLLPSILPVVTLSKVDFNAKVPDPLELGHFRPISILCTLSKALEIVMRDQMVAYLTDIGVLSSLQSGMGSRVLCSTDVTGFYQGI